MPKHICHATGCDEAVPERMFMCRRHWFKLTKKLRDALWAAYVPGQEIRKDPTSDYMKIARKCIRYVERQEAA